MLWRDTAVNGCDEERGNRRNTAGKPFAPIDQRSHSRSESHLIVPLI